MTSLTRALLGPLAGAVLVFASCSDPSKPEPDWFEGGDATDGAGDDGELLAGAASEGGSGPTAQGGRAGRGSSSAGRAGSSPSGEAGAEAEGGTTGSAGTSTNGARAGASNGTGGKNGGVGGSGRGGSGSAGTGKGGTPGSAGMTAEGGSDTGSTEDDFFGDSRCSDEFLFCDGFEEPTLRGDWRPQGTPPTFDTARKARGGRSAHFHAVDNGLSIIRLPMEETHVYYGRMFVYIDVLPTAPMWAHWSLAAATGNGVEAEIRLGGQFDGETNRFGVGTDHGPTGDWTLLSEEQDMVPVGAWVCLEWLHDAANNETRFWSDEVEHASLHTTLSDHGGEGDYELPAFTEVFVGWWHYQMGPTPNEFDVWIDEVAFHTERIGCTR